MKIFVQIGTQIQLFLQFDTVDSLVATIQLMLWIAVALRLLIQST